MSTRRKSVISVPRARNIPDELPALELERLEQETTLVLQEIDHNLSQANAVINDKMVPILRRYAAATLQAWTNVAFWKRFLEEAADVELSTVDDPLEPAAELPLSSSARLQTPPPAANLPQNLPPATTSPGMAASTPQRLRPLLISSDASEARHKRNPARLSVLHNFLNSSPTLPEPPVLLSEVGRHPPSSEKNPENAGAGAAELSDTDVNLVLSPVILPSVSLTPLRLDPAPLSGQRFPLTPNFRGNLALGARGSPVRRGYDDLDLPPGPPVPLAVLTARADDSDELPLPQLQTMRLLRPGTDSAGHKRRKLSAVAVASVLEKDNVFLEGSAVHQEGRSVSLIFEDVLNQRQKETEKMEKTELNEDEANTQGDAHQQSLGPDQPSDHVQSMGTDTPSLGADILGLEVQVVDQVQVQYPDQTETDSAHEEGVTQPRDVPSDAADDDLQSEKSGALQIVSPPTQDQENVTNTHDENNSIDTSELGSFLGQRWKSLSQSLRKS